jgi:putative intracellular protease/amidase
MNNLKYQEVSMDINWFLFNDFETLDLFGPVEVLSKITGSRVRYFSVQGGIITSKQHTQIVTEKISAINLNGILLVPGGQGTRVLVHDTDFIETLKKTAENAVWCLTVCTGSALLAKTGLLDTHAATSNKKAFEWARSTGVNVNWIYKARWVVDGKYYTSSGISAGMDMSLGFVCDRFGKAKAQEIAKIMEYEWNDTKEQDMFAV